MLAARAYAQQSARGARSCLDAALCCSFTSPQAQGGALREALAAERAAWTACDAEQHVPLCAALGQAVESAARQGAAAEAAALAGCDEAASAYDGGAAAQARELGEHSGEAAASLQAARPPPLVPLSTLLYGEKGY